MLNPDRFTIDDYIGKTFLCDCRKNHRVDIKNIIVSDTALSSLPDTIVSMDRKKAFVLYDATTYPLIGKKIEHLFVSHEISFTSYTLKDQEPVPDEATIGEVFMHYDKTCDIMIAVGSGTLNDISRFISSQINLPYIIVATAPSMDGFASNVAPLITNHMKITYEAHMPIAIIADANLLSKAPMEMLAAGIGDILGKYTSLCDWEIAHIVTGEYHCSSIVKMVNKSITTITEQFELVQKRDPAVILSIMEGLVLSGIAMSYAGNSRPASGSEHHLSHYWEMIFLFQGKKSILHGTKVGIGTIAVLKAYELLLQKPIDFEVVRKEALSYSQEKWETKMKESYFEASDSIIDLEEKIGKNKPQNVIERLNIIEEKWDRISETIRKLPTADRIVEILHSLKAPVDPVSIGIDKETFINSFLVAKELRNRYGLLQMLFDLCLCEVIALEVWEYFENSKPL